MELKKKIHILFLIRSLGSGGAEKVLINLLKNLPEKSYKIDLCIVAKHGVYIEDIPKNIHTIYLFRYLFTVRVINWLFVKYKISFIYKLIIKYKMKSQYDVAISFADSSYTDLLFFLPKRPYKNVTWVHSTYSTYGNFNKYYQGSYKRRIIQDRYQLLDHIVFVSYDALTGFQEIFGKFPNSTVIYNVLGSKKILQYKGVDGENRSNDRTLKIVAIGSLYEVKRFDRLIDAADRLKKDQFDFKVLIIGDGYLRPALTSQIERLNLQSQVELLGFRADPYPILSSCDIFISTSSSEALPTSVCEALILGIPVVATNCTGNREVLGYGKYGIMTEQNIDSIYLGLKVLLKDDEIRQLYRKRASKRGEFFNDDNMIKQFCQFIEELGS